MLYKRNQLEEAIASAARKRRSDIANRLKRLLDTDRNLGKPYGFYSTKPSGKGVEVEFTEYEAFALWVSLQLLDHGFPQQSAVETLRQARTELSKEHARILRMPDQGLFDQQAVEANARPGSLVTDNTRPAFFVVERPSDEREVSSKAQEPKGFWICRDESEMMRAIKSRLTLKTIFETVSAAKRLHGLLAGTKPEPRGRRPGS